MDATPNLGEPWGTILVVIRTIGFWQTMGIAIGLTILRVATPDNIVGAFSRLWNDVFPIYRDRSAAQVRARDAEAERDLAIAQAWRAGVLPLPHPQPQASGDPRSTGSQPAVSSG